MFTEEQIKRLVSVNDSLQVQIEDLNMVLTEREKELEILKKNLADAIAMQSKQEGQLAEIESIQDKLGQKQKQAIGAEERELELKQELNEAARVQVKYDELAQQYAYLQTQYEDVRMQLAEVNQRNYQLQQTAGRIGELESRLENMTIERNDLAERLKLLESEKYLREFNL
jgi:chromosome segregation ATPase